MIEFVNGRGTSAALVLRGPTCRLRRQAGSRGRAKGRWQDVGDAISARSFEPDGDGVFVELLGHGAPLSGRAAAWGPPVIWDRRSSQIAAEPFQAISFVGADADARVEVESVGLGA